MPKRRDPLLRPRDYVANWPDGRETLDKDIAVIKAGAPMAVHYMLEIARAIRAALHAKHLTNKNLISMTNLETSTIRLVMNGYVWPDMVTLTRIEQALEVTIWPGWGDRQFRDMKIQIAYLEVQVTQLRTAAKTAKAVPSSGGYRQEQEAAARKSSSSKSSSTSSRKAASPRSAAKTAAAKTRPKIPRVR